MTKMDKVWFLAYVMRLVSIVIDRNLPVSWPHCEVGQNDTIVCSGTLVNNQVTSIYQNFMFMICFPTYTVYSSFTHKPNFTNAGGSSYKYIKQNSEKICFYNKF